MAENLETTHLFGFTLGTDVNNVGEVEGELEAIGRFAKRVGVYNALSPTLGLKFIPVSEFLHRTRCRCRLSQHLKRAGTRRPAAMGLR